MQYILCDIDGVIAHRPRYSELWSQATEAYEYAHIGTEHPDDRFLNLLRTWGSTPLVLLTGRVESTREETRSWLDEHLPEGAVYQLWMKPDFMLVPDEVFKPSELVAKIAPMLGGSPLLYIDDQQAILNEMPCPTLRWENSDFSGEEYWW